MVSKIQCASHCNADSMASAKLDFSKLCVITSEPPHKVDNKFKVVLTEVIVDLAALVAFTVNHYDNILYILL